MKKLILGLLATVTLAFSSQAQADNIEQRAINKAIAAARECMRDGDLRPGLQLEGYATLNLYCDYFRFNPNYAGFSVEVYARPHCPPNQACIQVIYPVATVWVDCQGNAYQVECVEPVILEL